MHSAETLHRQLHDFSRSSANYVIRCYNNVAALIIVVKAQQLNGRETIRKQIIHRYSRVAYLLQRLCKQLFKTLPQIAIVLKNLSPTERIVY